MTTTMDTLARIFLTSLLFAHVYADDSGNDAIYKISSTKKSIVGPDSTETKIILDATVLFKPLKDIQKIKNFQLHTAYYITVQSLNISVQKGDSEVIDLNKCPSFEKTRKELSETFYVSYLNGLFEYLQVPKDNENLSVNMKFLLCELLQVNAAKLVGIRSEFSTETSQDTIFGTCDANYDVARDISWGQLTYGVNKTYDMNSCSKINQTGSLSTELDDICNPISKKNLQFDMKENLTVIISTSLQTIQDMSIKESISYNPWQDSSASIDEHLSMDIVMASLIDSSLSADLTDENSDIVTALRYSPVDKSLVSSSSSDPLQKTYSALACNPYNSNIYMEIYQHAINCS